MALVLAVGAVSYTIFGDNGLLRWLQLRSEVAKITAENDVLKAENGRLREEARRLATDKRQLERTAREVLGYAKSDELVFRFAGAATAGVKDKR